MRLRAPLRVPRAAAAPLALLLALACAGPLAAQDAAPASSDAPARKRNPTGSPLDTLMNTKLWPDVPEAKDFVRQARPNDDSLDYRPPWGPDRESPKPRSKEELDALRRELGADAARNKARGVVPPAAPF